MAKFTMELREIISTFGEEEVKSWFSQYSLDDYLTSNEIALINERGTFDKEVLASRIIEHYYTREIGTDAIGQFMLFVKDKMHEVMETYAHVIYSTALKFDPLATDEHTESYVGSNDNVVNATTNSNGSSLNIQSDTPQGQISKEKILDGSYASSTSASESEDSSSNTSTSEGKQNYSRKSTGRSGVSGSQMIEDYRRSIRAIYTDIVYELEPLFMGIY